jgi:hypothetical protein
MSTLKQDENNAVAALTQRMDRLCSEMDTLRQENVQLHTRIAQLEKDTPSAVAAVAQEEAAIEAEAQRRTQQIKDEELARELAGIWSSSEDEQQQIERAAPLPSSTTAPVQGRVSPREAAAAAAEARAQKVAPQMERIAKQEIIGRLQEIYKRQGKEAHWALGSYSLPRLKALLKELV